MEVSSDNLMGSNVINNVPSPSSSSSSSFSWRIHPMMEHETDESHVPKLSDRKLGPHEVPRLILDDNVENDKTMNLEFEQLEPEGLILMFEKGLKGDKLENFVGEKGMKMNKLKDLGIGIEEEPKKSEKGKGVNAYNKKLCEEIELLESMLKRGSYGLVDLQMMMEEVKGLKGSRKMVSDIKMKISELESELYDLKKAIVELKGKKSKELMMGCVKIEEEDKGLKCEKREHEDDEEEDDNDNLSKTNWGSIIASVGAVVVAATAVFLMGRSRVEVKSERRNRDQTG